MLRWVEAAAELDPWDLAYATQDVVSESQAWRKWQHKVTIMVCYFYFFCCKSAWFAVDLQCRQDCCEPRRRLHSMPTAHHEVQTAAACKRTAPAILIAAHDVNLNFSRPCRRSSYLTWIGRGMWPLTSHCLASLSALMGCWLPPAALGCCQQTVKQQLLLLLGVWAANNRLADWTNLSNSSSNSKCSTVVVYSPGERM